MWLHGSKWGGSAQRARAVEDNYGGGGGNSRGNHHRGGDDDGNGGRTRGSGGNTRSSDDGKSRKNGGNSGGDSSTPPPGWETPAPPAVTPIQSTSTSSSTRINNSATGGMSYTSPFRGQLPISSTGSSGFTASVRFTTDPSGSTDTVSIGVPPDGTSSTISTKSGSNAGIIAGAVIFILFILAIIGFLLHRRRVRRRNRIAPSAQYLAEYGSRPLSWGRALFKRRGSSQYYDIPHPHMSSIWQAANSQSGHSHAPENQSLSGQTTRTHMDEPEMRETQSQAGHSNVRESASLSGKTSIGAAAGHSPVPDDPFADDQTSKASSGH